MFNAPHIKNKPIDYTSNLLEISDITSENGKEVSNSSASESRKNLIKF